MNASAGNQADGRAPLSGLSGHLHDSVSTDPKGSLALQLEVTTRKLFLCLDAGPVGRTATPKCKSEATWRGPKPGLLQLQPCPARPSPAQPRHSEPDPDPKHTQPRHRHSSAPHSLALDPGSSLFFLLTHSCPGPPRGAAACSLGSQVGGLLPQVWLRLPAVGWGQWRAVSGWLPHGPAPPRRVISGAPLPREPSFTPSLD